MSDFNQMASVVHRLREAVATPKKVILTAPHAACVRDPSADPIHSCDVISGPVAEKLAEMLQGRGFSTECLIADTNRLEMDMNRPESRGSDYRNRVDEKLEGTSFLLDVHSAPDLGEHWPLDVYILRHKDGDNKQLAGQLANHLMNEGLSVAVVDARKPNDITRRALDLKIPALLVEFCEGRLKGPAAEKLLSRFHEGLIRFLEEIL